MPSRYYLPDTIGNNERERIRKANVCAECGEDWVTVLGIGAIVNSGGIYVYSYRQCLLLNLSCCDIIFLKDLRGVSYA